MTAISGGPDRVETSSNSVQIRHVRTQAEFAACVSLQANIWGAGFSERVPATILKISQRLGGVTAGAFGADGALLGFVFGITGLEDGEIVHWSDMLAVRSGMQNHGIGRRLKEFQCASVRTLGATRMYWTFDPLVARNAHFNLNRLGVRVSKYVRDMYGADTGSALHSGFGTDRFIVVLPIAPPDSEPASVSHDVESSSSNLRNVPLLNAGAAQGRDVDVTRFAAELPPMVRVEIPSDIFQIQAESTAAAAHWRLTTRFAFQWAIASGYTVERFERNGIEGCPCYVLVLASASAPAATA